MPTETGTAFLFIEYKLTRMEIDHMHIEKTIVVIIVLVCTRTSLDKLGTA